MQIMCNIQYKESLLTSCVSSHRWPVVIVSDLGCVKWEGIDIWTAGKRTRPIFLELAIVPQCGLETHDLCSCFIFTRPPPPSGALSVTNHEPTLFFFLLASRLPHVVQGTEGTGNSSCEVHGSRVEEESSGGVQLSHGTRFFRLCKWSTTIPLLHSKISSL